MTTDELNDSYFGSISDEDPAEEERSMNEARDMRKRAVQALEAKFADRGLKFTAGFEGNIPVVAYGVMDGLPFYFRYRGDVGRLSLGHPDPDAELKRYISQLKSALHEAENVLKEGGSVWFSHISLGKTDENRLYPVFITKQAVIQDFLDKPLNSYLGYDGFIALFSALVENLENVDIDLTQ